MQTWKPYFKITAYLRYRLTLSTNRIFPAGTRVIIDSFRAKDEFIESYRGAPILELHVIEPFHAWVCASTIQAEAPNARW